jgi:protein-S-isoprenylcysteine O-methyltransferase Ste14
LNAAPQADLPLINGGPGAFLHSSSADSDELKRRIAMAVRYPDPPLVLMVLMSAGLFPGLPVWGWGSFGGFVDHPARVGACLVVVLASIPVLFSGTSLGRGMFSDARTPWIFLLAFGFTTVMAWLPAYADRRDIATLDGDLSRYSGLALLILGCILRVGPMFELGPRFRPPWVKQEDHRLVTTGFYRYVRNPSYLGALLGMMGWFLVFRSGPGFLLSLLAIPVAIPLIRREEAMLEEEFGDAYVAYKNRTWRLIPFVN